MKCKRRHGSSHINEKCIRGYGNPHHEWQYTGGYINPHQEWKNILEGMVIYIGNESTL